MVEVVELEQLPDPLAEAELTQDTCQRVFNPRFPFSMRIGVEITIHGDEGSHLGGGGATLIFLKLHKPNTGLSFVYT